MLSRLSNKAVVNVTKRFASNGRFNLPPFTAEPFQHFPPGSKERELLAAECKKVRSEVVEIPCIVDGKEYFTGNYYQ